VLRQKSTICVRCPYQRVDIIHVLFSDIEFLPVDQVRLPDEVSETLHLDLIDCGVGRLCGEALVGILRDAVLEERWHGDICRDGQRLQLLS